MKRIALGSLVLALASGGLAWAASTTPMETLVGASSPSACQDGWEGCLANGKELSHEPVTDSAGRPMPAKLRVSWFEMSAGPAFSPFVPLSQYTGELPAAAVAEADPVEPEVEPEVEPDPSQDTATPDPVVVDVEPDPEPERFEDPEPSGTIGGSGTRDGRPTGVIGGSGTRDPDPEPSGSIGGSGTRDPDPEPDPEPSGTIGGSGSRDNGGSGSTGSSSFTNTTGSIGGSGTADPEPEVRDTRETNTTKTADPEPEPEPEPEPIVTEIAPEPPKMDLGCDNLVALEPAALMGKLKDGQKACLEEKIRGSGTITQKDKISRVLLINAEASGSKKEWERLAKRHLEDIDRSDPNLCFKYAQHLSRGGVGRAWGVIKWADYALENKSQWSGTTYKTRVYALYQLKAEAAMKLWEDANEKLVDAGGDRDEWAAKEQKYRGMAKDYSREWLDYARASSQDTKKPMSLCVSAAGSKKFCQD